MRLISLHHNHADASCRCTAFGSPASRERVAVLLAATTQFISLWNVFRKIFLLHSSRHSEQPNWKESSLRLAMTDVEQQILWTWRRNWESQKWISEPTNHSACGHGAPVRYEFCLLSVSGLERRFVVQQTPAGGTLSTWHRSLNKSGFSKSHCVN